MFLALGIFTTKGEKKLTAWFVLWLGRWVWTF